MMDDVLQPPIICVAYWRSAELPAHILAQTFAAPVRDVERRIGEDEIELLVAPFVLVEAALVVPGDAAGVDAAHREVHLG